MEFRMRARESIPEYIDITPSIPPLAFSLYDSCLSTHCSSCASPLPSSSSSSPSSSSPSFLRYCSNPKCAETDAPIYTSSAEHHLFLYLNSQHHPDTERLLARLADTSDLRLALRLLLLLPDNNPDFHLNRLLGLATMHPSDHGDIGSTAVAMARAMRDGKENKFDYGDDFFFETSVLSLIMLNAVEVNVDGEMPVGVAVYDWRFSWINHSCLPNSCFRFVHASDAGSQDDFESFRIVRSGSERDIAESGACTVSELPNRNLNYAPRIVVRSIKALQKDEEVTVTYTDLLQSKECRRHELSQQYNFSCGCRRCNTYKCYENESADGSLPESYVDHALDEILCTCLHKNGLCPLNRSDTIETTEMFRCTIEKHMEDDDSYPLRRELLSLNDRIECIDHQNTGLCSLNKYTTRNKYRKREAMDMLKSTLYSTIQEYMEGGDPVKCCTEIESLLCESYLKQYMEGMEQSQQTSYIDFKLSPLHHLSINAYTTLISVYKVLADLRINEQPASFHLSKTSAAYTLLHAGVTHHLFLSENSLIISAATFWIDAGKSFLHLARSTSWSPIENCTLQNLSAVHNVECSSCSLVDLFESNYTSLPNQFGSFDDISREFLLCISVLIPQVWSFLAQGCRFLEDVENPVDFSWLGGMRTSEVLNLSEKSKYHELSLGQRSIVCIQRMDEEKHTRAVRCNVFRLGVHSLLYGGYLSSLSYGCLHPKTRSIRSILYS